MTAFDIGGQRKFASGVAVAHAWSGRRWGERERDGRTRERGERTRESGDLDLEVRAHTAPLMSKGRISDGRRSTLSLKSDRLGATAARKQSFCILSSGER